MSARLARGPVAKISYRKVSGHSNLKTLSPKQMRQRLPTAFAQVKTGNTSENLLNEIRQIINSLYQEKEILKSTKQYNELNKIIKQNGYCIYEL